MKKIGLSIGFGIALIFIVVIVYAAMQPKDYEVVREISIDAPADKVFPYINNAKLMDSWNPWTKIDPKSKIEYSGPEAGIGAKTSWSGGDQMGTGSATVVESVSNSLVKTKLEYTEPFEMTQEAVLTLKPEGKQTIVRWSVAGQKNLMNSIMCLFMSMDKMVGGTFEDGLKTLKAMVEKK